jgi:uncharacterized membrane-anchored protein
VNAFLETEKSPPIAPESKFARVEFDNYAFRFERHTEFLSISFIQKGRMIRSGLLPEAFDPAAVGLPLDWARAAPATLFQAIWLEVGAKPPRTLNDARMLAMLDSRAVAANQFSDGAGQLHFAFDIDAAGFSRVALFNSDIPPSRMGRAVQRVVELETYRLLALLGFAAVRDNGGRLGEIEDIVGKLTNELAEQIKLPDGKVETLLSTLTAQAADLEEIYSKTSYRMAATKAYESIMADRIAGLRLTRLIGFQGVRGFLNRRMTPALDSCHAFSERLAQLSARITRAGDLLQTQTEMIIQRQNRDLLTSMNSRTKAQLHLQQTVERLSIAAVTYYGVGLVGYLAKPLPLDRWGIDLIVVKAAFVPVIAFIVWLAIRAVKVRLASEE